MFCQTGKDEILGDRRNANEPGLPEVAFDMIFTGVAETAVGLNGSISGLKSSFPGKEFGDIRFRATRLTGVV